MRTTTKRKIAGGVLALVVMFSLGMAAAVHGDTLIAWWKPVLVCMPVAAVPALLLKKPMQRLLALNRSMWGILAGFVVASPIVLGTFYALNYHESEPGSREELHVQVTAKYKEEHYRTRRVSRRYTTRGEKYYIYKIDMELPDGTTKKVEVPVNDYNRIRHGQTLTISVEQGFFGIPVIKNLSFPAG